MSPTMSTPYDNQDELPPTVRDHIPSTRGREMFRLVANSALTRGTDEAGAIDEAWGALRRVGYRRGRDGQWRRKRGARSPFAADSLPA